MLKRLTDAAGTGLLMLLGLAVAAASARYVFPALGEPAPSMAPHIARWPWAVIVHVAGGIAALTLGPIQLVTRRGTRRAWHRLGGRLYVLACLSSAVAGLWLALSTWAGPVATAGFGLLAVFWFFTTIMGWRRAVQGRIDEHRRWMIRSLALTCAAITLRLMIPAVIIGGLPFEDAYRAIAFLCWVPNFLLVELWFRLGGGRLRPAEMSAAGPRTG